MKLGWQTNSALALTSISPQMRVHLKLDERRGSVTLADIVGPDTQYDFGTIAHEWALAGERVTFELPLGDVAYTVNVEPLYAPGGEVCGVTACAEPAQAKVAESRRSSIAAHAETIASAGSWFYDARSGEYEWSDGLYELLGVECWMPFALDIRMYDVPEDAKAIELAINHARLTHESYSVDHRIRRADGAIRFVQEKGAFYFDKTGLLTHAIGTLLDITARKAGETRLTYLAYHDPLSDLPNRALLEDRFAAAFQRARSAQRFCALLFMDIDGFKAVNDSLGHARGDDLLRAIAGRLRRHVRGGDTLARLGGDEFVILLDGLEHETDAEHVAKTMLNIFKDPFTLGHVRVTVTASIGIAVCPPDGTTVQALLAVSDAAMYDAKRRGGNRFSLRITAMERQMAG